MSELLSIILVMAVSIGLSTILFIDKSKEDDFFNFDAIDGDGDGILQEGTKYERPAKKVVKKAPVKKAAKKSPAKKTAKKKK